MKGHYVHTDIIRDKEVFDNISKRIGYNMSKISDYYNRKTNYNFLLFMRFSGKGYTHNILKEIKTRNKVSKNKNQIFKIRVLEGKIASSKLSYRAIQIITKYDNTYMYTSLFRRKYNRTLESINYAKYSSDPKTMKELCIMTNNDKEADSEEE